MKINWKMDQTKLDIDPTLRNFERWLREHGYREACIDTYIKSIRQYLKAVKRPDPSVEDALEYHSNMANSSLARSTINIRAAAMKVFYRMKGANLVLPHLKVNNKLPYYFTESDVLSILANCNNLKHYAMLALTFYCMLRVSDLVQLELEDIDLKEMRLRIKDGKFGKSALIPIPPDCAPILEEYLKVRPQVKVNGKSLLFFTDRMNQWTRRSVEVIFENHKRRAGVSKPGSIHCWGRHTPASLMVKNGCDLYSLQQLMRHQNIKTTVRYLHMDDATLREKHNKFLRI